MKRHVVQKKKKKHPRRGARPRERARARSSRARGSSTRRSGEARGGSPQSRGQGLSPQRPLGATFPALLPAGVPVGPIHCPRPHLSAAGSHQHESPMPGPQSLAQRRPKVQPLRGFPRHPPPRAPAPRWGRTRSLAAEFGMLGGCTARSVGCHLCPRPVSINIQPRGKIRQGREPTSWAMLPQTEAPVTP